MTHSPAVIFPDTVPDSRVLIPLVPVFAPVVYCQPVENDDQSEPLEPVCRKMADSSLCSFHAPAPLGADRERFLRLISDLRQRRDDYGAQLTHVSLAGLSAGRQSSTESRSSILSRLLAGHGIVDPGQEMRSKILWQARLMLKLAEQHDAEQRNLAESLQNLHRREQQLFAGLSDEADNPFPLTGRLVAPSGDTEKMQRLRLKAWARLFGFGPAAVPEGPLITTDPAAVELLLEWYARSSAKRPVSLVTLSLPGGCPDGDMFLEQRSRFLQGEDGLVQNLRQALHGQTLPSGLIQQWEKAIESAFPAREYGRAGLILSVLPAVRIKRLLLDTFGHDEDELAADLAAEAPRDAVIGLLTDQSPQP